MANIRAITKIKKVFGDIDQQWWHAGMSKIDTF